MEKFADLTKLELQVWTGHGSNIITAREIHHELEFDTGEAVREYLRSITGVDDEIHG